MRAIMSRRDGRGITRPESESSLDLRRMETDILKLWRPKESNIRAIHSEHLLDLFTYLDSADFYT
jgi:hypothetical protein